MTEPQMLLFDEITANLDAETEKIQNECKIAISVIDRCGNFVRLQA